MLTTGMTMSVSLTGRLCVLCPGNQKRVRPLARASSYDSVKNAGTRSVEEQMQSPFTSQHPALGYAMLDI